MPYVQSLLKIQSFFISEWSFYDLAETTGEFNSEGLYKTILPNMQI